MEEGQRLLVEFDGQPYRKSLNPCCNGRGSKTMQNDNANATVNAGLNPCCNGRGSKTVAGEVIDGREDAS